MKKTLLIWLGIAAALVALAYGGYRAWLLYSQLQGNVTSLTSGLAERAKENDTLRQTLAAEQVKNAALAQTLQAEQAKNGTFETQIQNLRGAVSTLQKLSETDKELLQKYSKVYFLNENYVPSNLTNIDPGYLYAPGKPEQIHTGVAPFLRAMLTTAAQDGVTLQIVSAYRSFGEQVTVKAGYKVLYGSGANQFSADQGYSEHQLGTAIDFTTPEIDGLFTKFEGTAAYRWLTKNAYLFGFILSYPKSNSYYQFEPWHWRFVGTGLANTLHTGNKYFYDLSQREIDPYLISIFDY
jgi:zinc D-Ala-D-Ala carboxypeptidase